MVSEQLTTAQYVKMVRFLCAHVPSGKNTVTLENIHGSLLLHQWATMEQIEYKSMDMHDALIHKIIHQPGVRRSLRSELVKIMKTQPYSPADAICALFREFPGVFALLGKSLPQQERILRHPSVRKAIIQLIPLGKRDGRTELQTALSLIKSIEYWLLSIFLVSQ